MKEISAKDWKEFFNAFSREHEGWLVSAEVLSPVMGAQPQTTNLPFEGAIAEIRSDGNQIIILLYGATSESHVTHTIYAPKHIRFDEGSDSKFLQIESADNTIFILTFHRAKAAEQASK